MTAIHTVLFDLDGTLIDSVRLILDSYHHTLDVHGFPPRTDEHWLSGMGTPLRVQFRDWAHDPALLEQMIATYRDYNITHHDRMVSVYPGVPEVIKELRSLGLSMGLVTSKNRVGAVRGLEHVGLMEFIDVIIGADDVVNPKPHPEPVQLAAQRLGVGREGVVYVGDSIHDMQSGRAAGVETAAVLWGPFGRDHLEATEPDYWLETPTDLLQMIRPRARAAGRN
jgi:pyrophosphatase PpaX